MRFLFDIIYCVFYFLYLPHLVFKRKAHKNFAQRFGFLPEHLKGDQRDAIWIHTVSVGEVIVAERFIREIKDAFPEHRVVLSTTTRTGQETAKLIFGEDIPIFYSPLDFQLTVKATVNFIKPYVFIVFETEIWPNLILELSKRNVPVFLVNGRISDNSFKGYMLIRFVLANVLKRVSLFCMQTEDDAARIKQIGAQEEKVKIVGNMKYDGACQNRSQFENNRIGKEKFGVTEDQDILMCGSTHRGEEQVLIGVYKDLIQRHKNLRLFIAPRHISRVREIEALCKNYGFAFVRVSNIESKNSVPRPGDILILDTIGQLGKLYAISTLVYIGGSFIKKGGHNIIEPGRFAKPIVFGPYMNNFRDMAKRFLKNNASIMAKDADELKETFEKLLSDPGLRETMGKNAVRLVEENTGAVRRVVELIKDRLR